MGFGPPPGGAFGEKLVAVRTLLAGDRPGPNVVGKVASVALVIQREPLDRTVSDPERIEFVFKVPLRITPATRHSRCVVDAVWGAFATVELI
jgi:hypothetical protein